MKTKLISTSFEPVTLAEAKSYFRILHNDEDADISRVLDSATQRASQLTNRTLSESTFEMYIDAFDRVCLVKSPFISVAKVEYYDENDVIQPFTDYEVEEDTIYERAILSFNSTPSDAKLGQHSVIITYNAGYNPTPSQIQSYILAHALSIFENRNFTKVEGEIDGGSTEFYQHLLDSYRIIPV